MDNEIFERAQAIMSMRRQSALAENNRRIEEVNAKLPQIKEINDTIFRSGQELVKLISSGQHPDIKKKIAQLRDDNLEAQQLTRSILSQNGYPSDYLDLHYHCDACSDTGYLRDTFCDCFKKLCGKLSADKLNKTANLSLSSFDTFDLKYYSGDDLNTMKCILDRSKKYAAEFSLSSRSLFLFGKTGLGKTHISLAIANEVLKKGYSVIYDSAINILRSIEREHFSRERSSEMIDLVLNTELLILDDLGTEYESQFYKATIYNIINTRLNSGKPSIISTNLDFAGISERYNERVVSRIISAYDCFEFKGEDVRLQMMKNI